MMAYTGVDQMAWLSVAKEETGSREFKEWAETYLDLSAIGCSADDLWGARCGLLHTGAAESRDYRSSKAKLVYYRDGDEPIPSTHPCEVVFIHVTQFFMSFVVGALRFLADVELDAKKLAEIELKAGRMLSWRASRNLREVR